MILRSFFNYSDKKIELLALHEKLEDSNVWNNPQLAGEINKEKKSLENIVITIEELESSINDNHELFQLARFEKDEEII